MSEPFVGELTMCCGTTCNKAGNLKYVRGLLERIVALETRERKLTEQLQAQTERAQRLQTALATSTAASMSDMRYGDTT